MGFPLLFISIGSNGFLTYEICLGSVQNTWQRTLIHFELVWHLFKNRNVHRNSDIDRIGSIEFDETPYDLIERQNRNEEN